MTRSGSGWATPPASTPPTAPTTPSSTSGSSTTSPDWNAAVAEIAGVLRPGGLFYFEEVTRALDRWTYRTLFDHPTENRFSGSEFVAGCERAGLAPGDRWVERFFGDFVIGVATKSTFADGQQASAS